MTLDSFQFMQQMEQRMLFDYRDKAVLKAHVDWGKKIAPEMADYFYSYLELDPDMKVILYETEGRINQLKKTFIQWFYEMFTGIDDWGTTYAKRRWCIGLSHVRVGIGPQHMVPSIAIVIRELKIRIESEDIDESLIQALNKICMIDLAFIEQTYVEAVSKAIQKETGWTEDLFKLIVANGVDPLKLSE